MDKENNLLLNINEFNDCELRILTFNSFMKANISKYKIFFKIIFLFLLSLTIILSIRLKQNINTDKKDNLPNSNRDIKGNKKIIKDNKDNQKKKDNKNNGVISQLYYEGKNVYLTNESINKFNNYMDTCKEGILIDNKKYDLTSFPKISVIMPIYNGGNYLKYSLRSIQNQKMKNIEIILINDFSSDNTLQIIENYMKEEPRIRLINNEKNRRILYSKSIGALYANGEYIIELDQDDMFLSDDAFDILYNEAKNNNIDLIQFQDFVLKNFHLPSKVQIGKVQQWITHHEETYLEQPEIKNSIFKDYNFLLWGLFIKSDIYKKAVLTIWPIVINYKLIHLEDYHITFLIVAYVKNFKFMNSYFMVHLSHSKSAGYNREFLKDSTLSHLFFANSMIEYHIKNTPNDISMINNFIYDKRQFMQSFEKNCKGIFNLIIKTIYEYLTYEQKIYYRENYGLKQFKIDNTYEYFTNKDEYNSILSFQNIIKNKSKKNIKSISLFPKFSIIIYCNEPKFLNITLNSIQNQNFDNFEIILIYDNIKNVDEIIELIKDYINIELINNNGTKGLLYSYCHGILKSKGEYILTIQSGYILSTENILNSLSKNVDNAIDILEFNLLINNKELIYNNSLKIYRCTHFESEINVDSLLYNKNYKKIDQDKELLVNKLIKSNIFKDIINEYKLCSYDKKIYNYIDEILLFLFNKKNIRFKNANINGIIKYKTIIDSLNRHDETEIINDSIFYINFLFDHSLDEENSKLIVVDEFYNILNIIYNKYNVVTEEGKELIYKFINCKYIPQYNKNLLKTYYNGLINRNKYQLIK